MNIIRLATSSVNQVPLDWKGNLERLGDCIKAARGEGAAMLCLPELAITGYGCEDLFLARATADIALDQLQKLMAETEGMAVAVGLPLWHHNAVYNVVALVIDRALVGFYAKQNLAGDGLHYEPRWFRPWPPGLATVTEVGGISVPLGDICFDVGGVRIGFEVCEDAWVADRPGREHTKIGVDVILNPSASHFAFGKQEIREQFVQEGSRAFGVAYVYANLLGNEAGRIIYDGGSMIATGGRLVASGPRFSFRESTVTCAVVDLDINRLSQARTAGRDLDPGHHGVVQVPFEWPDEMGPTLADPPLKWTKEDEFTHALALGLFDYMRKSRSNGFVVSLSGGADSAAVACLVYLMRVLAVRELGEERFAGDLDYFPEALDMKKLLLCVYQATANSGDVTENAAAELAAALGAEFASWDVQPAVDHYIALAEGTIGRKLDWETDDITLQNIQARVRAPGIWMQANIRNGLLLATSNRSEAAVGYATMDGDTCGGLSPIAGIDKDFLRRWLRWLETEGSEMVPKIPALAVVNVQQPTAELRPAEEEQTDEGDLMPYPILDAIERIAIRDKKSPAEVMQLIRHRFPEYPVETVKAWVVRFFRLWSRNQWKRERYAPSFHLDDENLDPKTWCRFPILSSGFEEELEKL
ncbi:NAD(+) synthase [Haloferula sp.]|uniref:NAD(+) synthase n=1 Tax=Haloferula sp. TaxID=2497595 RepID=UPI003C74D510